MACNEDGAPWATPVEGQLVERQGALAVIRALNWMRCFSGWMPPGVVGRVDSAAARARAMRRHPAIMSAFDPNPADAFWEAKWQFVALRSAILMNSS